MPPPPQPHPQCNAIPLHTTLMDPGPWWLWWCFWMLYCWAIREHIATTVIDRSERKAVSHSVESAYHCLCDKVKKKFTVFLSYRWAFSLIIFLILLKAFHMTLIPTLFHCYFDFCSGGFKCSMSRSVQAFSNIRIIYNQQFCICIVISRLICDLNSIGFFHIELFFFF